MPTPPYNARAHAWGQGQGQGQVVSNSIARFNMDMDPDDVFRDDEDDPDNDLLQERQSGKELVVFLVDASPKMFNTTCPSGEDQENTSHFHVAVSCIAQSLKVQIINRPYDEIAICFFNTREKKNLQDLNGVYVFNVAEREYLDSLTARFIKEFDRVEGKFTWLDSVTNLPLKAERSLICADTGAIMNESIKRFQTYKNKDITFTTEELSEIKRVSTGNLRLLGFKPLSCLKDYHNLKPSLFVCPSDEEVMGSTCTFIALHRSMIRLKRFAVAFYGSSSRPQLVALVAQEEIIDGGGQIEPPGMHMIYLPYSDDIRPIEEARNSFWFNCDNLHADTSGVPLATDDQIQKAAVLVKRVDLKDFSVCQFSNPALQSHYALVQAMALDEDEMPEIVDETLPDEEGMARPGIAKALEEFKICVYGENYEEEDEKANNVGKKRKQFTEEAINKGAYYDWGKLADDGKLKDLTVQELKYYLTANKLTVAGKKEVLINRILTHMGK
ncbi:hypothetical protein M8C21_031772 [Ambrosia artemisiifolia]|uniref:SAP domain-containing protein n=1 Tax=Ambrosia artemisiifolia TaxID=4212 RepID=A0AAD5G265_AMBAR|nr:hypothetical protein M8C21_031772 [Ambrosia artemisiifolia]